MAQTYAFGDFAKYVVDYPLGVLSPVVAFMISRDAFNKLTPEQKIAHRAARPASRRSLDRQLHRQE
jgi:hypothetical protein